MGDCAERVTDVVSRGGVEPRRDLVTEQHRRCTSADRFLPLAICVGIADGMSGGACTDPMLVLTGLDETA